MLPPPAALRDTFDLLSRLDGGQELDRLLDAIDWQGVSPRQVSHAVLGRLPQDLHYRGLATSAFDPKTYFKALLLSVEFQTNIVPALLEAYPEKPRRFFVHVPRSGGTSLGETLELHACAIPYNSIGAPWSLGPPFLDLVAGICRTLPRHDAIHVSGHYTLRSLIDGRLVRSGDQVWTSIRDPGEIIVSYVNYVLTILHADPDCLRPDTRHWTEALGLKVPFEPGSEGARRHLLGRMIRHGKLLPRDPLCHFLGDGTAASAIDLLAAADVEVIASRKLDQWCRQRWTAATLPWANVSTRFFEWETLGDAERRQIGSLITQDVLLYRVIAPLLGAGMSTNGLTIARAGGEGSALTAAPPRPARVRRAARPILLDPSFTRIRPPASDIRPGWTEPPPTYRTIETTLRLPWIDARVRIRYARRRARKLPIGVGRSARAP